jgi:hypothetical protein
MMAVTTLASNPFQLGAPTRLFETSFDLGQNRYAPDNDGKRFLLSTGAMRSSAEQLLVVVNWASQLAITGQRH